MNFSSKKKGFTLIEMLIVIVIIGVLASALIPRLGSARGKANDVARKADLQQVATAIISYQIDTNNFPGDSETFSDTGFQSILIKGGMASIPVGDAGAWTGMDGATQVSGYMYYPMKKNGIPKNGFLLVAKTETAGGSNYVQCGNTENAKTDGTTDVDSISICETVALDDDLTCSVADCRAQSRDEFRYIYKY